VNGLGLQHPDNIRKMKLLTFMQMAENRSEITFQVRPDISELAPKIVTFSILCGIGNRVIDKIISIRLRISELRIQIWEAI
jgi:hypothetical protein